MFEWSSEIDANAFKTLSTLAKYNGGFFKSAKQAKFVLSSRFYSYMWFDKSATYQQDEAAKYQADALRGFNVEFDPATQSVVMLEASIRWASYGRRSWRRAGWIFVLDNSGVVAEYKLHYTYPDGSSSFVNSEKTETVFKRDPNAAVPVFEEPAVPVIEAGEWLGEVGKRSEFFLTVMSVKTFDGNTRFYYGDTGLRTMTMLKDEKGNKVVYWNECGAVGDKIHVKATVKAHDEYKGVKQTTLSRAKVLELLNPGE